MPANLQSAELTQVPPQANFDDCLESTTILYFDINGDGALDVVQGIRVKSNRYETTSVVPIVYLSIAAAKGGYCYSEETARQVTPADLRSIESARKRLGISHFECPN